MSAHDLSIEAFSAALSSYTESIRNTERTRTNGIPTIEALKAEQLAMRTVYATAVVIRATQDAWIPEITVSHIGARS